MTSPGIRWCNHCGTQTRRDKYCSPCRGERLRWGEVGYRKVDRMSDTNKWGRLFRSWRWRDPAFKDLWYRSIALSTCRCGELLVAELHKPKVRRASHPIIKTMAMPRVHWKLVHRLAAGHACLATGTGDIGTLRTWRTSQARWLVQIGGGCTRNNQRTLGALTYCVQEVEAEIIPLLKAVRRKAILTEKTRKGRL